MNFIKINEELCQGCGNCIVVCPASALRDPSIAGGSGAEQEITFGVASGQVKIYDPEFCNGCGSCVRACGYGAIEIVQPELKEVETKLKADQLWLMGEKARVYELLKREAPLSIEQIAEKLGISTKLASNLVFTLKNENKVFEVDKVEDNGRVWYLYSTEPPAVEERREEEKETAVVQVDPEKSRELRQAFNKLMTEFSTVKVRFMLETGKLDKLKEELIQKVR